MTETSNNPRPIRNDDDTEGHRLYSDRNVKVDVEPVVHGDDDTAGHGRLISDRNVKVDVQPVEQHGDEDADDVEGHRPRF